MLYPSILLFLFGLFNLLGINVSLFRNQFIFAALGLLAFFLIRRTGLYFFRDNAKIFYWAFIGILILTFLIGLEAKGSKRWIDFYFFSFQGSEFFKVFFIIFFADFFSRNRRIFKDFSFFLKSLLYFLLPAFIIFKQPDLGSAIIFAVIFMSITVFSGIPKTNIIKTGILGLAVLPLGWFLLKDYQRHRILTFFNPHVDQSGNAYNMIQAIVTVGSGKFIGRGLGMGTQSGLFFLPENHTDFAYSSLVEQFGFIGGFLVIFLNVVIATILISKILKYANEKSEDGKFKYLMCIGFFAYFIIQVFINIGMNLGIMPITGITLPLISYGGSSLITWFIGIALLP